MLGGAMVADPAAGAIWEIAAPPAEEPVSALAVAVVGRGLKK